MYLISIVLKRGWSDQFKNVCILATVGVDSDGYRRILGVPEVRKEAKSDRLGFLKQVKKRDPMGVRLVNSDACVGLVKSMAEVFPDAIAARYSSTATCFAMCPVEKFEKWPLPK